MTVLKSVHHINFVVADLDATVDAYQSTLGLGAFEFEELPERGVLTARIQLGEVWIVLVSPRSEDSIAAQHLAAHGEGFFLMSFGVDNLCQAMAELEQRGALPDGRIARPGIFDWQVADLETEHTLGVRFHLTQVD